MTYDEAMERFGHDAPDLRFGLEIVDCTDLAPQSEFPRLQERVAEAAARSAAINAQGGGEIYSRRGIDELTEFVEATSAPRGWPGSRCEADGTLASPIAKNFTPEAARRRSRSGSTPKPGDLIALRRRQVRSDLQGAARACGRRSAAS